MENALTKDKFSMKSLLGRGALLIGTLAVLMFLSFGISTVDLFTRTESLGFSVLLLDQYKNGVLYSIAFIGTFWCLNKLKDIVFAPLHFLKQLVILLSAAFFSLFSLLSVYFEANLSVSLVQMLRSPVSLLSFLAAFCGGTFLFYAVIRLIFHMGTRFGEKKLPENDLLSRFFGDRLYRNCILLTALCWLPQYIIRFPGVIPYDVWQSIAMHLGFTELTTQHPLIWGAIVGYLTEFGTMIGINWFAPLAVCLVQHILCILMVAYTVSSLKKFGFHPWILCGTLAFFIILPPMSLYASTLYNDCFYCLSIMLLTLEMMYYLYDRAAYASSPRHLLLSALAVFGTCFRYNGFYTMLAVIAVIGLRELILLLKRKALLRQSAALLLLCLILPLSLGQLLQNTLNDVFDAKEIRSRAMLSMPIQQSVRCLITHGDDIPDEDYDAIHAVLTWTDEEYAEAYDPRNFDGVKESFKIDATDEEMSRFLGAWLRLLADYPETCFMATANQTYYLFSPIVDNVRYYESISAHTDRIESRYNLDPEPYVLKNPVLSLLCVALLGFEEIVFPDIPVLGLMVNPAVYTILLFAVCLCALFRRDRRVLVLTVALLATLGITFLGPAVYNHPRYIYPIMYSMPILLAAFVLPKNQTIDDR